MDARGVGTEVGRMTVPVVGGERFRIGIGSSGRRYVFSRVDHPIETGDLDGAVVALVARDGGAASRLLWVGAGERAPLGSVAQGQELHAHWLAATAAERARVIGDLGESPNHARRCDGGPGLARAA